MPRAKGKVPAFSCYRKIFYVDADGCSGHAIYFCVLEAEEQTISLNNGFKTAILLLAESFRLHSEMLLTGVYVDYK